VRIGCKCDIAVDPGLQLAAWRHARDGCAVPKRQFGVELGAILLIFTGQV